MYCPKCGTQNPDNAKICQVCDQLLSASSDTQQKDVKTCNLAKWSFALAMIGLYAPFMYIIVLPSIGRVEIQQWWLIFIVPLLLSLNPPFALLFSVAVLSMGFTGLSKIKKSNGALKGKGLSKIGISISIIEVGFMLVLNIMFIMGEVGFAQRVGCRKNLAVLNKAIKIYAKDHQMIYPLAENWQDILITDYNVSPRNFKCPENDANEEQSCYAININIAGKKTVDVLPDTVLLFETKPSTNPAGGPEILIVPHRIARIASEQGCNVLFANGCVRYIKKEEFPTLRWTIEPADSLVVERDTTNQN